MLHFSRQGAFNSKRRQPAKDRKNNRARRCKNETHSGDAYSMWPMSDYNRRPPFKQKKPTVCPWFFVIAINLNCKSHERPARAFAGNISLKPAAGAMLRSKRARHRDKSAPYSGFETGPYPVSQCETFLIKGSGEQANNPATGFCSSEGSAMTPRPGNPSFRDESAGRGW